MQIISSHLRNQDSRNLTTMMDTSPVRQAKHAIRPQLLPHHKAKHSQTTIDSYLKPITKVRQGQNDIRIYFPSVAKTKVVPNSESTNSSSLVKTRATSGLSHEHNGATQSQTSGPSASAKVPVENIASIPDGPRPSKTAPGVAIRLRNYTHANSAVLPSFDPLFDNADFPHSTLPMAPRATDIVRHSLLPKPLNIKIPLPPATEPGLSPSQITSSPSSAGDADTASLDGERREAPSFKQTYVGVHSRHNTIECPISPLMALRDSSLRALNQRGERPGAMKSRTMPLLSEPDYADSVIYFLPQVSPTEQSEVEERKPLRETRYPKSVKKAKAEKTTRGVKDPGLGQMEKTGNEARQNAMTISPGKMTYIPHRRLGFIADAHRPSTVLWLPCFSEECSYKEGSKKR